MWRLYGDDGKGVCLVYERNEDSSVMSEGFECRKVSYEGSDAFSTIDDISKIKLYGFQLEWRRLDLWGLFVKSKQFAIEEEVRLLYHHKQNTKVSLEQDACPENSSTEEAVTKAPENPRIKWVLNGCYDIIIPVALFEPRTFPLRLKKIILGPNISEPEVNKIQIKTLLERKGINVTVEISNIKDYRSSK